MRRPARRIRRWLAALSPALCLGVSSAEVRGTPVRAASEEPRTALPHLPIDPERRIRRVVPTPSALAYALRGPGPDLPAPRAPIERLASASTR